VFLRANGANSGHDKKGELLGTNLFQERTLSQPEQLWAQQIEKTTPKTDQRKKDQGGEGATGWRIEKNSRREDASLYLSGRQIRNR